MKTYTKYFASIALAASVLMSCNKEMTAPSDELESKDLVTVTLGVDTKVAMSDKLGMIWQAGDKIQWRSESGNSEYTINSTDISEDGHTVTVTMTIPKISEGPVSGVFRYNYHGDQQFEHTLNLKNGETAAYNNNEALTLVQDKAGVMNPTAIFLHSGTSYCVNLEQGATEVTAPLDIVGTVLRFLPYTTEYNGETISSILLSSDSYLAGTVEYDYKNETYKGVNDVIWSRAKKYTVSLTNPMSLADVTSREKSSGFYMALPAASSSSNIAAYTITVFTDKAKYTYNSESSLDLGENKVKNVYLKLDAAHRLDNNAIIGSLRYVGALADSYTFAADADSHDYGYWYAEIKGLEEGSVWEIVEADPANAKGDQDFYKDVKFSVIDDATGVQASWCTAGYMTNSTHIGVTAEENTSTASRSATITITYDTVKGYEIEEGSKTKVLKVQQLGKTDIVPSITFTGEKAIPSTLAEYAATLKLTLNGTEATAEQLEQYISQVVISSTNCTVRRSGSELKIFVAQNPKTTDREVKVTVSANAGSDELVLTQAASASETNLRFSYVFTGWQESQYGKNYQKNYSASENTGEWLAVFENLYIDGEKCSGELSDADKKALVMQVLDLTEAEYNNSFLTFRVDGSTGEVKILVDCPANTTGVARTFTGNVWYADHCAVFNTYEFNQAAE